MFAQTPLKTATLALIVFCLLLYAVFGGYFARELVIEISILAILAISLDLLAGYGGMVSLCHGAIFGLGAYSFAIGTAIFGLPPGIGLILGVLAGGIFGLAVGAISARTAGVFFIMVTLAFGQMAYAIIFGQRALGGDDGMAGVPRLDFSWLGINLSNSLQFAVFTLVALVVAYVLVAILLRASFGRTLIGIHSNEKRMRAIGIGTIRHKAMTFGISGMIGGFAGTLAAQHTGFVSPELLVWTVSGEVLVVVILGGIGTLVGPVVGAALLVMLKHEVGRFTDYGHIFVVILLIVTVLAGGRGIYGQIEHVLAKRRLRKVAADA